MPINQLNSKTVKFSEECKKYDGKRDHIEAYEKFILDILRPRKFKLGVSTDQIKKGLKPETYIIPPISIEDSWFHVSDKSKEKVSKLLIDLCDRYESSHKKNIPILLTGSRKSYILTRKHSVFIHYLEKFLVKMKFVEERYFYREIDALIKQVSSKQVSLKPNDINEMVNEMMIFTIDDI